MTVQRLLVSGTNGAAHACNECEVKYTLTALSFVDLPRSRPDRRDMLAPGS